MNTLLKIIVNMQNKLRLNGAERAKIVSAKLPV